MEENAIFQFFQKVKPTNDLINDQVLELKI